MFHVDDLGRPALLAVAALTLVERLVQPDRRDHREPGRVVDQHASEQHDRVVHGVPITGEIVGDFGHCAAVFADLSCRPSRCACRQRGPFRRDRWVGLAPCPHRTRRVRATPPSLAPRQPCRTAEHRQIDQQHVALAVVPRGSPTACTVPSQRQCFDLHPQPRWPLANTSDHDVGQANEERAHARRIGFQQGLLDTGRRKTPSALQSPCAAPVTYLTPSPHPQMGRVINWGVNWGAVSTRFSDGNEDLQRVLTRPPTTTSDLGLRRGGAGIVRVRSTS